MSGLTTILGSIQLMGNNEGSIDIKTVCVSMDDECSIINKCLQQYINTDSIKKGEFIGEGYLPPSTPPRSRAIYQGWLKETSASAEY